MSVQQNAPAANLADALREAREAARIDRRSVLTALDISRSKLHRWERGDHEPSISEMHQLLDLYAGPDQPYNTLALRWLDAIAEDRGELPLTE